MGALRFVRDRRWQLWSVTFVIATVCLGCVSVSATEPRVGTAGTTRPVYRERDPVRVVVISAVPAELDRLLAAASIDRTIDVAGRTHHVGVLEGHPAVLFLGGVSLVNAAMSTQAVIDRFEVGAILFSGIAGGVNPNLAIGDVTVPRQWGQFQEMVFAREGAGGWETDGRAGKIDNFGMMFPRGQLVDDGGLGARSDERQFWFPVDSGMLDAAHLVATEVDLQRCVADGECLDQPPQVVVGGNGLSGSVFVNNAEFREYLWRTFEADAVDMETAAIAQVAAANAVPFLGFRSLSDLAGGGPGANQIATFGKLAADNSAVVLLRFLRRWRGPR